MTRSEARAAKQASKVDIRAKLVRCRDAWHAKACPPKPQGADYVVWRNAFQAQQQNMVTWIQKQINLFDAATKAASAAKDKTSKAL